MIAESIHTTFTPLSPSLFTPHQILYSAPLKDRKQFVQIDECASTLLNVTCGVPQGSILGPKLFNLYINDICNASTSLKFILFADDTNVFYSGVDIQTICECISRELDKLHVWLSVNKLSLNVDKANFILFGNRKNIDNVCISMNNSIITRVRATKLLGVIIDEKLTWKDHISLGRSKLSKTVGILYRIRHLLNRSLTFLTFLDHLLVQGRPVFESSSIFGLVPCLQSVGISSCLPVCCPSISFSVGLDSFSQRPLVLAILHRCRWVLASSSGQTTLVFCFPGKFQQVLRGPPS